MHSNENIKLIKERLPSRLRAISEIISNTNIIDEFTVSVLFSDENYSQEISNNHYCYESMKNGTSLPMTNLLKIKESNTSLEENILEIISMYEYMNIIITKKEEQYIFTLRVLNICDIYLYKDMIKSSIFLGFENVNNALYKNKN